MKKSLIALAVLAASGAAMAQSSVTIWGIVDATYAMGNGSVSDRTRLTNSGYNSSRLGFRGVEDLGGGMTAGFWLEAGVNNDDGSGAATSNNNQAAAGALADPRLQGLTFNRRSTVSVGGNWGEVRLGRDYTPQFWSLTAFDPFGTNGVGTTQTLNSSAGGTTTIRASNSIGYMYGMAFNGNSFTMAPGFNVFAQTYFGENVSSAANKKDGSGMAIRVGYGAGPARLAAAFSETKFLAGNIRTTNLAGSYNLGAANLIAHWNQDKNSTSGAKQTGYLVGATAPMGAGELRTSYSTSESSAGAKPSTDKFAIGYVHNLSKRTALYGTYARVSNSGGASQALNGSATAANNNSTGFDLGVRHSF
ncbi:MAG: porin [Burkholderiaceae bacterium]